MEKPAVTPELLLQNGFLLCLDVPEGMQVGMDLQSFTTGSRFKGMKLIPPGVHLCSVSYSNQKDIGPPTSMFLTFKEGQVIVKKWNPATGFFCTDDEFPEVERARYAAGVLRMEFDAFMGIYPLDELSKWRMLSRYITPTLLQKLEPISKVMHADGAAGPSGSTRSTSHISYYTPIPSRKDVPKGLTAPEVTRWSLDKSSVLEELIAEYGGDENLILGELQYSFVLFLVGQSYEGFEQWKTIVALLCSCECLLRSRTKLFVSFIEVVDSQLLMVPEDFFVDPLSERNFLTAALKGFFELLHDPGLDSALRLAAQRFQKTVEQRFMVSFNVEDLRDEDAPVLVEAADADAP